MLLVPLLLACGGSAPPAPPSGPPAATVEVAPAREGELSDTWTVLGEVRALERAELASGAAGPVERVTAREGDVVGAGALLVEVDVSLASAELGTARAEERRVEAELAQARRTLERVGRVASGVMAATEIEQAQARVAALEAQHEGAAAGARLAAARLGRHRVTAPFPGVVARRHVDPGDWVGVGTPVVDLVRTDRIEIRVDGPLELARRVHPGDAVRVEGHTGTVVGVVPALDPITRTAAIRVAPDPGGDPLVPGAAVDVAFDVAMSGGVVVPRDAVVGGPTDSRVFKVVDGSAEPVTVRTLATTADEVLVDADALRPGDLLVVRGNERLRPGQAVRVLQ